MDYFYKVYVLHVICNLAEKKLGFQYTCKNIHIRGRLWLRSFELGLNLIIPLGVLSVHNLGSGWLLWLLIPIWVLQVQNLAQAVQTWDLVFTLRLIPA